MFSTVENTVARRTADDSARKTMQPTGLLRLPANTPTQHTVRKGMFSTGPDQYWNGVTRAADSADGYPRWKAHTGAYARAPYLATNTPIDIQAVNQRRAASGTMLPVQEWSSVSTTYDNNGGNFGPHVVYSEQYPQGALGESEGYAVPVSQRLKPDDVGVWRRILDKVNPRAAAVREAKDAERQAELLRYNGRAGAHDEADPAAATSHEQNHLNNMPTEVYSAELDARNVRRPGFSPDTYAHDPVEGMQALAAGKRAELTRGNHIQNPAQMRDYLSRIAGMPQEDSKSELRADEYRLRNYLLDSIQYYDNAAKKGVPRYVPYTGTPDQHPVFKNISETYAEAIPDLVRNNNPNSNMYKMAFTIEHHSHVPGVKEASPQARMECQGIMNRIYKENPSYWPYGLNVAGHDDLYIIRDKMTKQAAGFVGWQEMRAHGKLIGSYSIGILPEYRGNGMAKEAVAKVIRAKAAGVDEVRAYIVDGNRPSEALANSLGVPVMRDF